MQGWSATSSHKSSELCRIHICRSLVINAALHCLTRAATQSSRIPRHSSSQTARSHSTSSPLRTSSTANVSWRFLTEYPSGQDIKEKANFCPSSLHEGGEYHDPQSLLMSPATDGYIEPCPSTKAPPRSANPTRDALDMYKRRRRSATTKSRSESMKRTAMGVSRCGII